MENLPFGILGLLFQRNRFSGSGSVNVHSSIRSGWLVLFYCFFKTEAGQAVCMQIAIVLSRVPTFGIIVGFILTHLFWKVASQQWAFPLLLIYFVIIYFNIWKNSTLKSYVLLPDLSVAIIFSAFVLFPDISLKPLKRHFPLNHFSESPSKEHCFKYSHIILRF